MPCYTIQRSKVEFLAKTTDLQLLQEAMTRLGYEGVIEGGQLSFRSGPFRGWFDKSTGRLTIPTTLSIDAVKRAYSVQVVESQSRKFGWKVSWTTNAAGNQETKIIRSSR